MFYLLSISRMDTLPESVLSPGTTATIYGRRIYSYIYKKAAPEKAQRSRFTDQPRQDKKNRGIKTTFAPADSPDRS